jgi:hypothetical protein
MNCKQGDLAIVVKSEAGNEGKIVRCVRLIGERDLIGRSGDVLRGAVWEIDVPLPDWGGRLFPTVSDDQLRPIRDNDGEDEILRIAGKPQKVTA